jgi:pimeloyl-[acyl-carrier protein] synthase
MPPPTPDRARVLDECFAAPDFYSDMHAHYRRLREEDPVHWSDALQTWFLTGYADIDAVHRDSRFSSVGRVIALLDRLPPETREQLTLLYKHYSPNGGNLIHLDRPEHTRIRKLFSKPFGRREMEPMRPRIQAIVDDLIDRVQDADEIDLIRDFAFPLPIAVICDLLGISIGVDRDRFIEWCHDISDIVGANHTTETALSKQNSLGNLRAYIESLLEERRGEPRDDFYTMLMSEQGDGDKLTDEEIIASSVTLINGSHETTTNLIGNSILSLQRFPEQEDALRRHPELIDIAVEEFLRFESPLNHTTRVAVTDVEFGGQTIRAGQVVGMSLVAANRDPAQFDAPDTLNIERSENRHIAFAVGPHFCLGAPLARMEAQIALGTLMTRFPAGFRLLEEPPWRQNRVQHGLTELRLAVNR